MASGTGSASHVRLLASAAMGALFAGILLTNKQEKGPKRARGAEQSCNSKSQSIIVRENGLPEQGHLPSRVCVLGAASYVGVHVVLALLEQGVRVLAADDCHERAAWYLSEVLRQISGCRDRLLFVPMHKIDKKELMDLLSKEHDIQMFVYCGQNSDDWNVSLNALSAEYDSTEDRLFSKSPYFRKPRENRLPRQSTYCRLSSGLDSAREEFSRSKSLLEVVSTLDNLCMRNIVIFLEPPRDSMQAGNSALEHIGKETPLYRQHSSKDAARTKLATDEARDNADLDQSTISTTRLLTNLHFHNKRNIIMLTTRALILGAHKSGVLGPFQAKREDYHKAVALLSALRTDRRGASSTDDAPFGHTIQVVHVSDIAERIVSLLHRLHKGNMSEATRIYQNTKIQGVCSGHAKCCGTQSSLTIAAPQTCSPRTESFVSSAKELVVDSWKHLLNTQIFSSYLKVG